jgi:ParB-like chromosome segregation protein Spo0J
MSGVKTAFALETMMIPLDRLLPTRALKPGVTTTRRYNMIRASVGEVGVIEPLVIYPQGGKSDKYVVLDGHLRLEVVRELGWPSVTCIVSTDDENCTYNHRVSRLAPIQEHRMILKAIDAGVSEERIAKALNVQPKTIRDAKTQLVDISPDAIEVLKDKPIADMALRVLKKVKPFRQVEMAELMCLSNSFTARYAKALLAATPPEQLVEPPKEENKSEQLSKLEAEMRAIEREFVVLEESYSSNTLNLQLARAYLKTLLANARVAKYLGQKHPELLGQLRRVVEATSLEG